MTTFERNRVEPLLCQNCGSTEEEHVWRCRVCGSPLPSGRCGCGAAHMPDALCLRHPNAGAYLFCKEER